MQKMDQYYFLVMIFLIGRCWRRDAEPFLFIEKLEITREAALVMLPLIISR